jgi:hypothetical protein
MYNSLNKSLAYKSIRAINDVNVINFLKSILKKKSLTNILNDNNLEKNFLKEYRKWLTSSRLNKLQGLNNFKFSSFANGSSQIFDYFYDKNKKRRFRAFKGEYAYHYTSWRNHFPNWKYINKLDIKKNDAVIISLPFSDTGSKHSEMEKLIRLCDRLDVPVLVDCCYYSMCKGINFNFNHKSIKEVAFSLSKAFPVSRARIGMRLSKIDDDDPLFFLNKIGLVNRVSIFVGLKLIKKFKFDYIYRKYFKKQIYYCQKLSLKPSSVVCLATGGDNWKEYNRGNKTNRLCLSGLYEEK